MFSSLFLLPFSLFALFLLLIPAFSDPLFPIVPTKFGRVKGFVHSLSPPPSAFRFRSVDVFFGIPFATPPIGEFRFEKPIPPKRWHGVRNAIRPVAPCVPHARKLCNKCSEDCLYLNIFTPHQHSLRKRNRRLSASSVHRRRRHSPLFPVLFLIHGGAFEVGSAADFDNYTDLGMRYVSAGIVVVSIQYRLGIIGFSSTGDKQMAGNFGLWDQFAALEFVSENIAQFGGNPADITLFGESAGAASVSFLGLSPHSQGLFQKCVQLSGSPLSAWALNGRVINETAQLAAAINCAENGREGIKECLKGKTVDELFEGVEKVGKTRQEYDFTKWGPLLDGDFLPADIPQLIERAPPKPTVMGIADLETLLWTLAIGHNDSISLYAIPWDEMANFDRRRFEMFVQNFVTKRELFGQQMATELQREIVQFYTRDKAVERIENEGEYYVRKITLLLSDLQFAVPVIWEAAQKAQKGWPIYFFKNSYFNEVVFPKVVKVRQNFHANDFIYFFDRKVYRFEFNANDKLISNFLMDTVINFVKTANPSSDHSTVQWLPMAPKDPSESFMHLLIEMPMPKMNPKMEEEIGRAQFWTQMRTKHPKIDLIRGQF